MNESEKQNFMLDLKLKREQAEIDSLLGKGAKPNAGTDLKLEKNDKPRHFSPEYDDV